MLDLPGRRVTRRRPAANESLQMPAEGTPQVPGALAAAAGWETGGDAMQVRAQTRNPFLHVNKGSSTRSIPAMLPA